MLLLESFEMRLTANFPQTPGAVSSPGFRLAVSVCALIVLVYAVIALDLFEHLVWLSNPDALSDFFRSVGPFAVIVLLAVAVVVSPIPSGPIAMAAGALYGPLEGGALTAVGALLGAMIAFSLSRWLGYRPLCASDFAVAKWVTRPRTQFRLALAVLISRLIPFISFDAVSYVAGLTAIRLRNFALATTVGILPASFAFAALGAGMATMDNAILLVAACGVTLALPAGWFVVNRFRLGGQLSGSKT